MPSIDWLPSGQVLSPPTTIWLFPQATGPRLQALTGPGVQLSFSLSAFAHFRDHLSFNVMITNIYRS
jgi:hypothetical protein